MRKTVLACVLASSVGACESATGPRREISGQVIYDQYCARCHGPDGKPVVPGAPDFSDPNVMAGLSDMGIKGIIKRGAEGRRNPATGDVVSEGMPGFGEQFTEATLMVLVSYLRSLAPTAEPREQ